MKGYSTVVLNNLRNWGIKGATSIIDQGVVSGSNFLLNILLCRWLEPNEYGAFTLVFSLFLFLAGFQNALILEPLSVYGSTKYLHKFGNYIKTIYFINLILTAIFSLFIGTVVLSSNMFNGRLYYAALGLAISMPFILQYWLLRRLFYVIAEPGRSLSISVVYSIVLLSCIYIIKKQFVVSSFYAFISLGLAGTAAFLFSFSFFNRPQYFNNESFDITVNHKELVTDHWRYGKWLAGVNILDWIGNYSYLPLIAFYGGLSSLGAFRSFQNLVLPLGQLLTAISLLALPQISKVAFIEGPKKLAAINVRIAGVMLIISLVYLSLINIFGPAIISLFYGNHHYKQYFWILLPYSGIIILRSIHEGLGLGFRVINQTKIIFYSHIVSAVCTVIFGTFLIRNWAIGGALIGWYISIFLSGVLLLFFWHTRVKNIKS